MSIKSRIRQYIPEQLLLAYHACIAHLAAWRYGYPSRSMVMVGITGTKGKTSTANYVWSVLEIGGFKTGLIGTANIRIGTNERMNEYHMTMPGPFIIQKLLAEMREKGCSHVVMEVTSEGIKLNRHRGIDFDTAVFTNLSPEHLPSHGGSFDKYREAKERLFALLMQRHKIIGGKQVPKFVIANADNEHAERFLQYPADMKVTYGIDRGQVRAEQVVMKNGGVEFSALGDAYTTSIAGIFNVYNALPAIIIGRASGIPLLSIKQGVTSLSHIPGRMELINEGQPFTLYVDYAHEKVSMNLLLDTAQAMREPGSKIIVLLGAEGGGRDKAKRAHMGHAAGEKADIVIASNVDPYEDEPLPIAEGIAVAAREKGKRDNVDLFVILDRREGIKKALSLAQKNDIVLITGKGAEQSMMIDGKSIPWDDRTVVRELLKELPHHGA